MHHRGIILVLLVLFTLILPSSRVFADEHCFPETNTCINGLLGLYWQESGSFPIFGFPITNARNETNLDTGQSYLTQWFERSRLELHPENLAPYDVLLGRLGSDELHRVGRNWQAEPRERGPKQGCLWFDQTGHNVCDQASPLGFKTYWETHGLKFDGTPGTSYQESLALFGLPLTVPQMETNGNGDTVLTQWFERARFEWHPNNPAAFRVLLGLLGGEVQLANASAPAPAPPDEALVFHPVADAFVHSDFPDENFGRAGLLVADLGPHRETYLKFELSGLSGSIASAKLWVYVSTLTRHDGGSWAGSSAARMNDTRWTETDVTYNTRPAVDGPILATVKRVMPGQWYEFDVTVAVTSNGILGLALIGQSENGAFYTSREVSNVAPRLVVTLAR